MKTDVLRRLASRLKKNNNNNNNNYYYYYYATRENEQ